jgi:hypothetical protein
LKDMMLFQLKVEELPLPRGLSIELLEHLYKKAADEEVHEEPRERERDGSAEALPAWATEPVRAPGEIAAATTAVAAAAPVAAERESATQQHVEPAVQQQRQPAGEAAAAAPAPPANAAPEPAAAAAAAPPAVVLPLLPELPPGMPPAAIEADQWVYRDPNGLEQGVFSKADILDWFENGFFPPELPLRSALPGQEVVWTSLEHMVRVWALTEAYNAAL